MGLNFFSRNESGTCSCFRPTASQIRPQHGDPCYTQVRGEGELGKAMLNNALAVGVAGAVVVVTATILGAVELLWKAVAVGVALTEDEIPHDKDPENSRRQNDPLQPIQHRELLTTKI
jgi:hypothetical protein